MTKPTKERPAPLSLITIVGEGFDEWGQRYFKLRVEGSSVDLPPYSMDRINKDPNTLYTDLSNAGANVFTTKAKGQLLEMLQNKTAESPSFRVATHPGWHGSALVFPDKTFGRSKLPMETSFVNLDQQMLAKYRKRGTLEQWQKQIWARCPGNSRLLFALSLAAAPLILPLVKGPRSGGFQFVGDPETGKTGAAVVAGSFWGCHRSEGRKERGFAESWNTTSGKVEVTALAHNHCLLILDETKLAGKTDAERAQNIVSTAVGLAEHTEKERLTNVGAARSCCCYFLSTSNHSLIELGERGGIEIDDAERGRLVDVFLPAGAHGLYEDLHGFAGGGALTDELKALSRRFFGAPRHEFAKRLTKARKRDKAGLKRWLNRRRREYLKALRVEVKELQQKVPTARRPLQRASGKFATVYAAGALASKYGIYPIARSEILTAVLRCEIDGLGQEHKAGKTSAPSLKDKLTEYLRQNRARFLDLDADRPSVDEHEFGSAPGYVATFKGERWLYLTSERLDKVIGAGKEASALKKELVKARTMVAKKRFVVQRPIFRGLKGNKGSRWVHAFRVSILDVAAG
jgi:putative DNA primase/helicase